MDGYAEHACENEMRLDYLTEATDINMKEFKAVDEYYTKAWNQFANRIRDELQKRYASFLNKNKRSLLLKQDMTPAEANKVKQIISNIVGTNTKLTKTFFKPALHQYFKIGNNAKTVTHMAKRVNFGFLEWELDRLHEALAGLLRPNVTEDIFVSQLGKLITKFLNDQLQSAVDQVVSSIDPNLKYKMTPIKTRSEMGFHHHESRMILYLPEHKHLADIISNPKKLKQLLSHYEHDKLHDDHFVVANKKKLDKVVELILKHCKPYLREALPIMLEGPTRYVLFRGLQVDDGKMYHTRRVRKNRQPLSSDPKLHKLMDTFFVQNYGIKFRSSAIFTTNDMALAQEYGSPHVILPVGQYSSIFTKNAKMTDLYSYFEHDAGSDAIEDGAWNRGEVFKHMKKGKWEFNNIPKFLKTNSGAELMIACDHYVAISYYDMWEMGGSYILKQLQQRA